MSGLRLDIGFQNLDDVRARFGQHTSILDSELRRAENAGLAVLRQEVRSRAQAIATDARLPNSIRSETIRGGLEGIVGSLARTGLSIEEGRRPGDTPSITNLANWAARKGLAGETFSLATHRRARRSPDLRRAERALAWRIALAVRERGTKPLPFVVPAARARAEQVRAIFSDAMARALGRLVGKA